MVISYITPTHILSHLPSSHTFLLAAHKAAGTLLDIRPEIPEMTERAEALYHMFGQGNPRADWFPHELIQLEQLATMTVGYQNVMEDLLKEGFVVTNARRSLVLEPKPSPQKLLAFSGIQRHSCRGIQDTHVSNGSGVQRTSFGVLEHDLLALKLHFPVRLLYLLKACHQ